MEVTVQGTGLQVDPTLQLNQEPQPMPHLLSSRVIQLYTGVLVVVDTLMGVVQMENTHQYITYVRQQALETVLYEDRWMKSQDQLQLEVEEGKFLQMAQYLPGNVFLLLQGLQQEGPCQIVEVAGNICCLRSQKLWQEIKCLYLD